MADCLATYVVDGPHLKRISFVWRPRGPNTVMDAAALKVVEAQLEAYNRRDLEGFMALIADDVQVRDLYLVCVHECMTADLLYIPDAGHGMTQCDLHYRTHQHVLFLCTRVSLYVAKHPGHACMHAGV